MIDGEKISIENGIIYYKGISLGITYETVYDIRATTGIESKETLLRLYNEKISYFRDEIIDEILA